MADNSHFALLDLAFHTHSTKKTHNCPEDFLGQISHSTGCPKTLDAPLDFSKCLLLDTPWQNCSECQAFSYRVSHSTGHPKGLAMSRNVRKKFRSQTGHPKKWLCSNPWIKSHTLISCFQENKLEYRIFQRNLSIAMFSGVQFGT